MRTYMLDKFIPGAEAGNEGAQICLGIWKKRLSGEYSYEEGEKELAYVTLNFSLAGMAYQVNRMTKPEALQQLHEMPVECRIADQSFWQREDIKAYMDHKHKVKWDNVFNFERLLELREIFAKHGDTGSMLKVVEKVRTYPRSFQQYHKPHGGRRADESNKAGLKCGRNQNSGEVPLEGPNSGDNGRIPAEAQGMGEF